MHSNALNPSMIYVCEAQSAKYRLTAHSAMLIPPSPLPLQRHNESAVAACVN